MFHSHQEFCFAKEKDLEKKESESWALKECRLLCHSKEENDWILISGTKRILPDGFIQFWIGFHDHIIICQNIYRFQIWLCADTSKMTLICGHSLYTGFRGDFV